MDIRQFLADPEEKPLDRMVNDGGFASIFRTVACVGDSLSSGEFESLDENGKKGFHDDFDYSWGQYFARMAGCKVYNFSRGGMTAKWFLDSFGEANGYFDPALAAQAYVFALGVNDLNHMPAGTVDDIHFDDPSQNPQTFAGYFGRLLCRYREISPKARFFLMTMPRGSQKSDDQANLMRAIAEKMEFCYVIDFNRYAPVYDDEFKKTFYLGGHLNPMGYILTAKMLASYMDYLIRHNIDDFRQVGFIGTPYHNSAEKW